MAGEKIVVAVVWFAAMAAGQRQENEALRCILQCYELGLKH